MDLTKEDFNNGLKPLVDSLNDIRHRIGILSHLEAATEDEKEQQNQILGFVAKPIENEPVKSNAKIMLSKMITP